LKRIGDTKWVLIESPSRWFGVGYRVSPKIVRSEANPRYATTISEPDGFEDTFVCREIL